MRIWFDADNAPHVHILRPLAEELRQGGHEVRFTARDRTSTCQLLDLYGLSYEKVGTEYGAGIFRKATGTVRRAAALARVARSWRADVSFGHGSRSLPLASRLLGVPSVTMYDYEWVNPQLFNLFCDRILLPEAIHEDRCREAGIRLSKVRSFPGYKEELYLHDAVLDASVADDLGLQADLLHVLLRPPATTAHYHDPASEAILDELLRVLTARPDVQLVYLARTPDQLLALPERPRARVVVPDRVYDGPSLIGAMDLVIGGGGTMTREAALMGVPSYSFFQGRSGRVDAELEERNRLVLLRSAADVADRLQLAPKPSAMPPHIDDRVRACVIDHILAAGRR